MTFPRIVSQTEWQAARDKLLVKEKELRRAMDATPFGRQETWEDSPEGRPSRNRIHGGGCTTSMSLESKGPQ